MNENEFLNGLVKFKKDKTKIEEGIQKLKALAKSIHSKNQVFKKYVLAKKENRFFLTLFEFDGAKTANFELIPEKEEYLFETNPKQKVLCKRIEGFNADNIIDEGRYLAGEKRKEDEFMEAKFYGNKLNERYVFRTVAFKKGGSSILFWKTEKKDAVGSFVDIETNMKSMAPATFDGKISLPMSVSGELLREGTYYTGTITKDELFKAYKKLIGQEIILFATHDAFWGDSSNVADVLGKLNQFDWDEALGRIVYRGEIYDEEAARKVLAGLVKGISAGFDYEKVGNDLNKDIDIREATLTFRPHCKTADIKVAA